MGRWIRSRSLVLLAVASAIGCGSGGNNPTGGGGGSASSGQPSTGSTPSTSTSGGGGAAASTSTSTSTSTSGASSSSGVAAMGDPCRGIPLPTDAHYVPAGMCARLVAKGVGGLRQITFTPDGDMFGVTAGGSIRLFHDADNSGTFEAGEITEYANTGGNGNNCHIDVTGGYLYAGSPDGVMRWPYAPGMKSGGQGEKVVTGQAGNGNHPKHTVHVYDGYLYVHSGSSGNASDPMSPQYDTDRSLLRRFDLSMFKPGTPFQWSSGEVYSAGIRNMVGYTRNASGRMFGVVNGLDDIHYMGQNVHADNPGEQVLELGMGKNFGYPFCFTAQRVVVNGKVIPAGTQLRNDDFGAPHDDAWCAANSTQPATFVQAHSAPLDITFFDDAPTGNLPEKWRGGAFVALHGSWDRPMATGYKVVFIPADGNGDLQMPVSDTNMTTFPYETAFGGGDANAAQDGPWSWNAMGSGESPRPVGVAISPVDGALYISSDASGMVYRIGIQH